MNNAYKVKNQLKNIGYIQIIHQYIIQKIINYCEWKKKHKKSII